MDEETEEDGESTDSPLPTTSSSPSPVRPHEREPSSVSVVEDLSPCYQLGPSPTGGAGLFATRPIPRGTVIFAESPLFTQPLPPHRTNSTILNTLAQHSREEQCAFFALANAYKAPLPGHPVLLPALGIFETNALPCGGTLAPSEPSAGEKTAKGGKGGRASTDGGSREGIFLQAARLNHSCRPNVARTWDVGAQEMAFRALRDVAPGEELCMSYVDVDILGTREERGAEIEGAFGFVCACEACMLDGREGEESDRRRLAVRRLFEEIGTCGKEPTLGLRKVKLAIRLLNEEQLVHYETSFCFDAFQFCVMVSDFTSAKAWVKKAWEASCNTAGPDSPAARTFKMYWANPRAHQLAGMHPRMMLSGPDDLSGDEVSSRSASRASL
ncbi:SET domain-containing protein [Dichomitus squalens]|uniref:SET domain-containing protein n=1 Tax=Dichomitus squalens TaxID=114155 RepID=A0A4Q9MNT3_9APHY|nr:SET domain-containing protein [Dichomitus squalens]